MDTDTASKAIVEIRRRLREIQVERDRPPAEHLSTRGDLQKEERELHARLAALQAEFSSGAGEDTREIPTAKTDMIVPPVV